MIEKLKKKFNTNKILPQGGNKHENFTIRQETEKFIRIFKTEKNVNIGINYFQVPLTVDREEYITKIIENLTKNSPRLLERGTIDGRDFLVVSNIEGKTLKQIGIDDLQNLIRIISSLAETISQIHKKTAQIFGDPYYKEYQTEKWTEFLIKSITKKLEHPACRELKELAEKNKIIEKIASVQEQSIPVLVVYDLHEGNILVGNNGNANVFDFDHTVYAPPGLELVCLEYNLFGLAGEENRKRLREEFNKKYAEMRECELIRNKTWNYEVLNHYLGAIISYEKNPNRQHFVEEFKKRAKEIIEGKEANIVRFY